MARRSSTIGLPPEHRDGTFWRRLTDEERKAFVDAGTFRRYRKGAALIHAMATDRWAAVIDSGRVRVMSADKTDGRGDIERSLRREHRPWRRSAATHPTQVISIRYAGDIIGEQALVDGKPQSATVIAETEVRALVVDGANIDRLFARFPHALHEPCAVLSERLRECNQRLVGHAWDAFTRVVHFLLSSVVDGGRTGAPNFGVHIGSQAALGERLGVSRDSVIRALRHLREENVVTTNRGLVTVRDVGRLHAYSSR